MASEESIQLLAEMMLAESYRKGEYIFRQGEVANDFYIVASGEVSIISSNTDKVLRNIKPFEGFGEYGMFNANIRTADAVATEDVELLSIDYQRFREFLIHSPEAMFSILSYTVERLTRLEQKSFDTANS